MADSAMRYGHGSALEFLVIDIVCRLSAAQPARQPLYRHIGEARDAIAADVSSLVLPGPQA